MSMDRKTQYCLEVINSSSSSIYRFSAIPVKTPARFSIDNNKLILKFLWRGKRPRIAHSILKDKNRGPILLNLETFKLSTL